MDDLTICQRAGPPATVEELSNFLLIAPEKATAMSAEIRAIKKAGLAADVYLQKIEEQRCLCDMILDASVRLGEIAKQIPRAPADRKSEKYQKDNAVGLIKPKSEAIRDLGFSPKQVQRFETLADNRDLVELEKAKAKEEGRMPTRTNVIDMAQARKKFYTRDAERIDTDGKYGNVPQALSALIRTSLIAAPGMSFVDADFSAIEARVIAWLSGEEWVLDVFRTHGKIYETTAAQMFGVPFDRIQKGNPEYAYRKKGKVATLALGYQGSKGALINMRKTLGMTEDDLPEADMPDIVRRWRSANPHTVQFWYDVNDAAYRAVTSGQATTIGRVTIAREIYREAGLDFLTIRLPCGRKLYYPGPHIGKNHFGEDSILYWGQDGANWKPVETYGGKLVENITQAVARDCLFYAMEQLNAAGYPIVFDIHDEVVLEVPEGMADLTKVVEIMSRPIPWAPGLPLNADGWVDTYFKKD